MVVVAVSRQEVLAELDALLVGSRLQLGRVVRVDDGRRAGLRDEKAKSRSASASGRSWSWDAPSRRRGYTRSCRSARVEVVGRGRWGKVSRGSRRVSREAGRTRQGTGMIRIVSLQRRAQQERQGEGGMRREVEATSALSARSRERERDARCAAGEGASWLEGLKLSEGAKSGARVHGSSESGATGERRKVST